MKSKTSQQPTQPAADAPEGAETVEAVEQDQPEGVVEHIYVVQWTIKRNGVRLEAGAEVAMPEAEAAPFLASGSLMPKDLNTDALPPAE